MTILDNAALEHEISSGQLPRAAVNVAYRQMLATERVAAALEKIVVVAAKSSDIPALTTTVTDTQVLEIMGGRQQPGAP